jgi:hypothetical protein
MKHMANTFIKPVNFRDLRYPFMGISLALKMCSCMDIIGFILIPFLGLYGKRVSLAGRRVNSL